jgi:hypothetical protein
MSEQDDLIINPHCCNCEYCINSACHRHSPISVFKGCAIWPFVYKDYYCGDHKWSLEGLEKRRTNYPNLTEPI